MSAVVEKLEPVNQVSVVEHRAITPMDMLDRAIQGGANLDVLNKLMDMQDRWEKTQARKAFDLAISKAKAEIPVIAKNATGHNSKKYANFAAIAGTIDPIISRHGLSYRFRTQQGENGISVTCVLSHEAGHFEETTLRGPADQTGNKNAIQAIGSTLTYLQRYSLVQALGLAAAEDDDGKTGGADTLSEEQATTIRDLLASIDNKDTEARFLKWLKVEKVGHIPASRFDEAVAALKKAAQS